jgi:hypothetical protein
MNGVKWQGSTEAQYMSLTGVKIATTEIIEQQKQIKLLQELLRKERIARLKAEASSE